MFGSFVNKIVGKMHRAPTIRKVDISRHGMKADWNSLVTAFDLRMWYMTHQKENRRRVMRIPEIEELHKSLDWLHVIRNFNCYFRTY